MRVLHIIGGKPLSGEVRLHGAKNAALPILTATAAFSGVFTFHGCPRIRDVETTLLLLRDLGVESVWEGDALRVDSRGRYNARVHTNPAASVRTSSLLLGVLTGAWGEADVPYPGGCSLSFGKRPLDIHMTAFESLGITCEEGPVCIRCFGKPAGGTVSFPFPSVGATENVMLLALGASGPVRIEGAAMEPEIADLADFLNACGAEITGAGTSSVEIRPAPLHGAEHRILPDRIEAVTYLCAAACTGGSVTLTNVRPGTFRSVLDFLQQTGCEIEEAEDRLTLKAGPLRAVPSVVTGPYPAFPTDAQPLAAAVLATAKGVSCVTDTVFPDRFRYADALHGLGADVRLQKSRLRIRGVDRLHGAEVFGYDLRASAAAVCAALGAEGESRIRASKYLDRGYQDLVPILRSLGAEIEAEGTETEEYY